MKDIIGIFIIIIGFLVLLITIYDCITLANFTDEIRFMSNTINRYFRYFNVSSGKIINIYYAGENLKRKDIVYAQDERIYKITDEISNNDIFAIVLREININEQIKYCRSDVTRDLMPVR